MTSPIAIAAAAGATKQNATCLPTSATAAIAASVARVKKISTAANRGGQEIVPTPGVVAKRCLLTHAEPPGPLFALGRCQGRAHLLEKPLTFQVRAETDLTYLRPARRASPCRS